MTSMTKLALGLACLLIAGSGGRVASKVRAFPGAEGFGAASRGGRGGRVIEVTTLNDRGPGSFRHAVEVEGARTVVFRVGGTILLREGIEITHPYLTIAGQTAPGGGITLRNDPSNRSTPLSIKTHNVIIRYLRSRPGPCSRKTSSLDALDILGGHDIILDHCSFSWAVDEVVSTWYSPRDITIQWCVISEGLYKSAHKKGPHSMGLLLGDKVTRLSAHHNLMAHNDQRNPRLQGGIIDVVNNVVYNYGSYPAWITVDSDAAPPRINFVGNYIKPGSNSKRNRPIVVVPSKGDIQLHVSGNIGPHRPDEEVDEWKAVGRWDGPDGKTVGFRRETRHDTPPITTTSAAVAYEQVLSGAGCTVPLRDPVDRRVVADVKNGTGRIIDHPSEVGGWPELAPGKAPKDGDRDGMPDAWEAEHGLDSADASDGAKDRDGDGYTNLEEYLNSQVGRTE